MTDKPENPPAFPQNEFSAHTAFTHDNLGMTLRDYFASHALAGMAANEAISGATEEICKRSGITPAQMFAIGSYEYADAMLAQRTKP